MDGLTRALVESAVALLKPSGPVVEIGSRQVQDLDFADMRPLFPGTEYVGCDMMPGPGVDRIEQIEALSFADGWAGTVLCLNVLEHVWAFREGVSEIQRVTAPGGVALLTTVFGFHIHGFPDDYWRFTPGALARLFAGFESVLYGWQGYAKTPRAVFVLGLKQRRNDLADLAEAWRKGTLERWADRPPAWERIRAGMGAALFGQRRFRDIRHWRNLVIRAGEPGAGG